MTGVLRADAPGPLVTLQDVGRPGWRRFGISGCGAMDVSALELANVLVGNQPHEAALEFAQFGGVWEILADSCRIAVTGGDFGVAVDGIPLAPWRSHTVWRGQRLAIRTARDAVWGYLAVAGGFAAPPQLGSLATHVRSRIGGIDGNRIAAGDELALRATAVPDGPERRIDPPYHADGALRVVLGPQEDYFSRETIDAFLASRYRVSHRSDRMGTWLEGPPVAHARGFNVLSDGLVPGCVQVPGTGQPVVVMKDCQTIGGYPKLATLVTADLARFAQTRPGREVRFAALDVAAAQDVHRAAWTDREARLAAVEAIEAPGTRPFWLRR